jgi:HD-GYP domain-containing protein (c-di-GMP phosphodiesterase class II)
VIQEEQTYRFGKGLINQFHVLLKTAQIHDPRNVIWDQPIANFIRILDEFFRDEPEVSIVLEKDCLFLNDTKLRIDIGGFVSFMSVIEEMRKRQVGKITLSHGVSGERLKQFIYLFVNTDLRVEDPYDVLVARLGQAGFNDIHLERLTEKREKKEFEEVLRNSKEIAKKTYYKTISVVSEVMENVKLGQMNVKKAKRVVQSLVDMILQEETTLLGLTTLRSHDEYTHNHSVNVCILSLSMGQRMGYNKRALSELGMAALFHDIGKAEIPLEVLNKPTDFDEEDWKVMRRHPILGVELLVKMKGLHESALYGAIGAFEHHLNYDLSGYPRLNNHRDLTLLGRIIGIVDCYDALTSSRVYNRTPFSPENALKFMLSKSGKAFDPILLKLFVNCIGFYPVGTLVLLNTREMGVVMANHMNPEHADRPKIKLVTNAQGQEVDGALVDLSDGEGAQRQIIKTIDSTKYKIDVSRYFI